MEGAEKQTFLCRKRFVSGDGRTDSAHFTLLLTLSPDATLPTEARRLIEPFCATTGLTVGFGVAWMGVYA